LNLIRGGTVIPQFEITEEVIRDPKAALDQWIRAFYVSRK
jgi:hypothetical protein